MLPAELPETQVSQLCQSRIPDTSLSDVVSTTRQGQVTRANLPGRSSSTIAKRSWATFPDVVE